MDKLKEAARLVAEVAAGLNREASTCECCGRNKYENWGEQQMATELDAIVRKLERFAK